MTAQIIPLAPRHPKPDDMTAEAIPRPSRPATVTVEMDPDELAALRKFAVGFWGNHPDRDARQ